MGGVAVEGEADWLFEPEEVIRAQLRAGPPKDAVPTAAPGGTWAEGRLIVGRIDGRHWRQKRAGGRFSASGGELTLYEGEVELAPSGRLQGMARLDLSRPDEVPFWLRFELADPNLELGDFGAGQLDEIVVLRRLAQLSGLAQLVIELVERSAQCSYPLERRMLLRDFA